MNLTRRLNFFFSIFSAVVLPEGTAVPTEVYGDIYGGTDYIAVFFILLFEFKLNNDGNGAVDWFSDENFNNFKEFVIALCRHKSIPEELTSSLKNV